MPGKSNKFARLTMVNGKPVGRRYARISDAAEYLDVNPITIRQMLADGKIRAYRSGQRLIRVDLNEIDAFMAGDTEAGTA
jgi:excisionase family DNA binding protein